MLDAHALRDTVDVAARERARRSTVAAKGAT
jgi:hypothetical protein